MNKRIRKASCILVSAALCAFLCGCWDYRGVNEDTVVFGVAVDKTKKGDYHLSYEILDLINTSKEKGVKTKMIESEGDTIFEAVRSAKKKLANRLYFGNTLAIVINKELAKGEGISDILDCFLRNSECRETTEVVISEGDTAGEILSADGCDSAIISSEVDKIVENDQKETGSARRQQLYQVYNTLTGEGTSLGLPAFSITLNEGKPAAEVAGTAVFKGDKLQGFLTPEDSRYYLFVTNTLKGGVISVSSQESLFDDMSLEITENSTDTSFENKNGVIKLKIKTNTTVELSETKKETELTTGQEIKNIQNAAEKKIKENMIRVIRQTQKKYNGDIFGFGQIIYKKDPKLWNKLRSDWDRMVKDMDIEVSCKVTVSATEMMMS